MSEHCLILGEPTFWSFIRAEWWVPRFECGWFPLWLILLYAGSQMFLAYTYWRIGKDLSRDERMRKSHPEEPRRFSKTFMACGWSHLLDGVLVFVWPHYLVFACLHLYTAFLAERARKSLVSRLDAYEQVESIVRLSSGTKDAQSVLERLRIITEGNKSVG